MKQYILENKLDIPTSKIVKWAEFHRYWNPAHRYWEARTKDFLITMTAPEQEYPWHSDSHTIYGPRNNRTWTRIIYLTEGSPIQFAEWDEKNSIETTSNNLAIYAPTKIEHEIYPFPGLQIDFPSFYLHRVPPQPPPNNRWAIVVFLTHFPNELYKTMWKKAYESCILKKLY